MEKKTKPNNQTAQNTLTSLLHLFYLAIASLFILEVLGAVVYHSISFFTHSFICKC